MNRIAYWSVILTAALLCGCGQQPAGPAPPVDPTGPKEKAIASPADKEKPILRATLEGHPERPGRAVGIIRWLAISCDGKLLASGADNSIKLWDVTTGKEMMDLDARIGLWCVTFSSDGKLLAAGGASSSVELWDVATGKRIATLNGHKGNVRSVAFSGDGKMLASGSFDGTAKLWDVATAKEIATIRPGSAYIALSRDGKLLATGGALWDVATKTQQATFKQPVLTLALSGNGKVLATSAMVSGEEAKDARIPGVIKVWDVATQKEKATIICREEQSHAEPFPSTKRSFYRTS